MAGHRDPEHLGLDASVEALHHAIRLGCIGPRFAVLHPELSAGRLEPAGREAGAAVREHMGDLEGEGLDRFVQEGHSTARGFVVLDGEVDEAGGAVDGDIQLALAALAVSGPELGQVLHVHVHEAEIVRLEAAMRSAGAISWRQAAQALGFQDAVDRITVEMG